MDKKILDVRNMACPKPVIETKNALQLLQPGQNIVIQVNTPESRTNIEQFLHAQNLSPQTEEKNNYWEITVRKKESSALHIEPQVCCVPEKLTGAHVICITSNRMGSGADELGQILIRAFVNSIHETNPLPQSIIMYNAGIELALKDSPVLGALKELQAAGVDIIVCGTCTKYFNQTDNVAVGRISNMFEILEVLSKAQHVVNP